MFMEMCQPRYRIIEMTCLYMDSGSFNPHSSHGKLVRHEQNLKVIGQSNHAVLSWITVGFEKSRVIDDECRGCRFLLIGYLRCINGKRRSKQSRRAS